MKVLILSDSHGLTEELTVIKERHRDEVQAMIHCGDSELSHSDPHMEGYLAVQGNCDYDAAYPEHRIEEVGATRFLVTHGHLYNIKMTLTNLLYKSEETEAQVICFGHSHLPGSEMIEGRLFINPGSIHLPRGRKEPSYCLLEIEGTSAALTFLQPDGTEIKDLAQTYHFS